MPPSSIQLTLKKCRLFQERFGILSDVTTKKSIRHGIAFSLRTLQWSFLANELANELRAELAFHTRILSLHIGTTNLHTALEERVENHEIREQNRELIRLFKTHSQVATGKQELVFPQVPQHIPLPVIHTRLELPEVPQHQPSAVAAPSSSGRLAELETACRDLEALDHLLKDEERAISDLHLPSGNDSGSRNATDYISFARKDLELQKQRITNYHKRIQHLPSQASMAESAVSEPYTIQAPPRLPDTDRNDTWHESESAESDEARPISYRIHRAGSSVAGDFPAIGISLADTTDNSSSRSPLQSRRESIRRRGTNLPDDVSVAFQRHIKKFEAELEELDQYDVDNQIAKTREDLYDLIQRSFPPSPDSRLAPSSPGGSNHASPRMDGMLSSSPPVHTNHSRRSTFDTINTRRGSVDGSSWRYLAKDVQISGIPYSCARCNVIEHSALQFARRSSGGLCFRLLCLSSLHRPSEGLLFRHDLPSGNSSYPHIYHRGADPDSENFVRIFGQPTRLERYASGQKFTLQAQSHLGLCYRFSSQDDSETFQQLVYGARLVRRFDVKSITSSAYSGHPTRQTAVRIWESMSSGSLSITFRALLVDRVEEFPYAEHTSAFTSPPSTSKNKVTLKLSTGARSIPFNHRRTSSASSDETSLAGGPSLSVLAKIKKIEIELEDQNERDEFLKAWKGEK